MFEKLELLWSDFDASFWLTLGGGLTVKAMLSEKRTIKQLLVAACAGIFCALLFTGPVLDFLRLDGEYYEKALVAIFALTGEQVVRRILEFGKVGSLADIKKVF